MAALGEVRQVLRFVADFSRKEDVEIQGHVEAMQALFDLTYAELEQKLKALLRIKVEKQGAEGISNEALKDTIFKFKVIDFVMKFYELISITKLPFREYVQKDLSREMFRDSLDFSLLDEFDAWLAAREAPPGAASKREPVDSEDSAGLLQAPSQLQTTRRLVAEETVRIDRRTLLNPAFAQLDVLLMTQERPADALELDLPLPLVISLLFECAICKDPEPRGSAQVKESLLARGRLLNSRSSKKGAFRSHKTFLKGSRSLSSGKKPSPFKFQTEITSFFDKKTAAFGGPLPASKADIKAKFQASIISKKEVFNSFLSQLTHKISKQPGKGAPLVD